MKKSYNWVAVLWWWYKAKRNGHLQVENCSENQQQSCWYHCVGTGKTISGSRAYKDWNEKTWHAWLGGLGRRGSLLVYDAFKAHMTDPVKASPKCENADVAVIPGSLDSIHQMLDVSLRMNSKEMDARYGWWDPWVYSTTTRTRKKSFREISLHIDFQWIEWHSIWIGHSSVLEV